jgi:predicted anti-sigma-YlaC factor YlaD
VHYPGPPHDGSSANEFPAGGDEITCRQFVELVTDYFEGALGPRTQSQIEEHLVMCDWCVTYADQIRATVGLLGELGDRASPEPPASVLVALRARKGA